MKKIIINARSIKSNEIYGVQRYLYELLRELDDIPEIDNYSIEVVTTTKAPEYLKFKHFKVVTIDTHSLKLEKYLWSFFTFPMYVKKQDGIGIDLIIDMPVKYCKVVAIHDCIVEKMPNNYTGIHGKLFRFLHILRTKLCLRYAETVITVSEYSKNDIAEYYHIDRQNIKVIYSAWQHMERVANDDAIINKLGLNKGKYYFSLGSRSLHKNFKWIIEAAKNNKNDLFVVTGSHNVNKSDLNLNDDIPSNLMFTGYLSDVEIKSLMKNCKMFIQPSLYEGFGLPPLEAISVGARCIVSNVTSLPEVYKDFVLYLNPNDYCNLDLNKMGKKEVLNPAEILNFYSWKKSALELLAVIKQLSM